MIEITENGTVHYDNEPDIDRDLLPNIPSPGEAVRRAETAATTAIAAKDAAEAAAEQAMTDTPEGYADLVDSIAPAYSSSATYAAGDYVLHDSKLYEANQDIDTAESWTAAHWTFVRVMEEVGDLKDAFYDLVSTEQKVGKNKLITSTVTVSGNVGATRNVAGDVYLENGKSYRVQLWNAHIDTPAYANITSSKLTIRDNTDTNDLLTIINYTAVYPSGETFTWESTTGWYKFHAIVASANTISSDVLADGFFVYYNSLYPSTFEIGVIATDYAAKNSDKLEGHSYDDIMTEISTAVNAVESEISNDYYAAIGDSITAGSGASSYSKSYYWKLSSALITSGVVKRRMNLGVAGAGTQAIASNCGAYGVYLANAVTIPATTDSVEITLNREIKNSGSQIIEANRNNQCYLSGIAGSVSYSNSKYYFTRTEAGSEKYVAAGMPLLLYGGKMAEQSDIITIFAGTNNALDTDTTDAKNAAAVEEISAMAHLSKTGKYIVISPYISSVNNDFRSALSAKFGQRFFDMYAYMSGQAVYDAIAEGLIESGSQSDWATLLLSDGVHPNDVGHQLIAERIFEHMQSLGWC